MEDRVKCILLLLGEEADSFAKRAEMYYKRRPEVISSVEEAYRAYRALAERYDHMSGELHKANHTVATAFPDQVQYSMLEEDDDSLPKAFTAVDPRKIHKSTVEGLMNKKKGRKPGQKDGGKNCAAPVNKENAQKEISRMQKEILVLQTEKEFIKSSYESGIAKYWDLEKQINDMHEEVCYFQEEFNESAVIEDDEARALMTASALKSCEDAIARLREQQKLSFSQAMVELERASVSREKLKNIMKEHGKFLSDSGNSLYENVRNDATVKMDDLYSMKQEKIGIEAIVDKIKEYFQKDTDISVAEIAERIDDMVNKVVDLELMVSSQTAKIDRLCLENTELEISLQELEGEQAVVNSGSGELNDKLEKAEDELMRVQYLESSFHAEESIVYSNFAETASSFCCITDLLQSPPVEHQAGSAPRLTHEATPSADTASSGEYEKIKPEEDPLMDKATRKPDIDGLPDCSSKLELATVSDNSHQSNCYNDIKAERHDCTDDLEDLWDCGFERNSSFAVASVNKETAENADNSTSGEHNNAEVKYNHGAIDNNGISMQPYVVHSHEQGSLDRLHHISSEVPGDHHAKLEDDKQDSSTAGHSISKGHYEQEMKKAEESEDTHGTENSIPGSEIAVVVRDQEENMANLQKLLMSGLQDKEKVLLTEYTSILRNYKNAKRRLTEVEIKNQECLDEMKAMMSELRSANELKDKEIRSLRELLNTSTVKDAHQNGHQMNTYTSLSIKSGSFRGHRRIPSFLPGHQRRESASSISRIIMKNSSPKNKDDASHDAVFQAERIGMGDIRLTNILEMQNASPLEDKFRRDIDGLLEENLDFWMKFSTSFEKILELQTKHDQLQSEIGKRTNADRLKENSGGTSDPRAEAEPETIEKRLRELKIEMQVWLEQNAMFKGELQCRFASLCSIQEEIQAAMEMDAETVEGIQFTSYHAAKFQGEILSMKQENDKVADELQAGLDYIRGLQEEVEKILAKILKSTSLSGSKGSSPWRNAPSKSRVPLRSFLFPAKKKKPSLLACMNPALQKQYSDMAFFAKME
uniref:NAB domain-containing protein n=1 Tax=Aegilops tauschii subsp. strangulata TaxID=200361 RepID=A0A452XRB4_AEGTS